MVYTALCSMAKSSDEHAFHKMERSFFGALRQKSVARSISRIQKFKVSKLKSVKKLRSEVTLRSGALKKVERHSAHHWQRDAHVAHVVIKIAEKF